MASEADAVYSHFQEEWNDGRVVGNDNVGTTRDSKKPCWILVCCNVMGYYNSCWHLLTTVEEGFTQALAADIVLSAPNASGEPLKQDWRYLSPL
nr:hypothetical protein Iba_chr10aCG15580 [Ipomoea batatas]